MTSATGPMRNDGALAVANKGQNLAKPCIKPTNPAIVPLLFQTGYLTIKALETMGDLRFYCLCFPNGEVRTAFNRSLVSVYTNVDKFRKTSAQGACIRALQAHDLETFFDSLSVFFANIPYDLTDRQNEWTWQAILVTLLTFVGMNFSSKSRAIDDWTNEVVE